jgi:hypothetical protein
MSQELRSAGMQAFGITSELGSLSFYARECTATVCTTNVASPPVFTHRNAM